MRGRQPKLHHTIRLAVAGKRGKFRIFLTTLAANKSFNKNRAHNQAKHNLAPALSNCSTGHGSWGSTRQNTYSNRIRYMVGERGQPSGRKRALATFVNYLTWVWVQLRSCGKVLQRNHRKPCSGYDDEGVWQRSLIVPTIYLNTYMYEYMCVYV